MRAIALIIILFGSSFTFAQSVEKIKMESLESMIQTPSKNFKVFNFWASWCGPCVKELPFFMKLDANPAIDVKLVSVDFPQDIEKAKAVLEKRSIKMNTYLLDEKNFVERIDNSWTGAIPATLIIAPSGKRYFYEKSFTQQELKDVMNEIMSK
jgi:thiol-disulfide isomerase/thioredoxin